MRCPSCGSNVKTSEHSDCPACGFPVVRFQAATFMLYGITSFFFLSIVVYAAVVAFLPRGEVPLAEHGTVAGYATGALGVILLAVVWLWRELPASWAPQQATRTVVLQAALAETPPVAGLVAYLLTGDMSSFVIPLGLSLVIFIVLAARIPRMMDGIRQWLLEEPKA